MRRQLAYSAPLVGLLLLAGGCAKPAQGGGNTTVTVTPPVNGPATPVNGSTTPRSDSVGTVGTTFQGTNGTDHVSCSAIDTELLIYPNDGRIRWTARAGATATDSYPFVAGSLPSVVLDPASGVLDPGQRQILHISGTFDGSPGDTFYVAVTAPNPSGYSGNTLQLYCV